MMTKDCLEELLARTTPSLEVSQVDLDLFPGLLKHHQGLELTDKEDLLPNPRSIRQHTEHGTVESFTRYCERFRSSHVAVYADPEQLTLKAYLDYHADEAPQWCRHTAGYALRPTRAFARWLGINGQMLAQVEIAEFIEAEAEAIIDPSAADMLTLAHHFDVKRDVKFTSKLAPQSDAVNLKYVEEDEVQGQVSFPRYITLNLRTYQGTDPADVRVRFRYQVRDGKLRLGFKILDLDALQEALFEFAVEAVRGEIGDTRLFTGSVQ